MNKATNYLLAGSFAIAMSSTAIAETKSCSDAGDKASATDIEQATLVLLRGEEDNKTRRINFNIFVDDQRVGRFSTNESMTKTLEPGTYTINSNFGRDNQKSIQLEAGKTYYIKASVNRIPNRYETSYELVTEDYAFNAMPQLAQTQPSEERNI